LSIRWASWILREQILPVWSDQPLLRPRPLEVSENFEFAPDPGCDECYFPELDDDPAGFNMVDDLTWFGKSDPAADSGWSRIDIAY
jgi:hypothetical protein